MTDAPVFYCKGCGRRLPVVEVETSAIVICRYCKERTRVSALPAASFRRQVQTKN